MQECPSMPVWTDYVKYQVVYKKDEMCNKNEMKKNVMTVFKWHHKTEINEILSIVFFASYAIFFWKK